MEASRERTSGSRISVQKNFYSEQVFGSHTSTIDGLSGQVNLLSVNVSSDGGTAIGR